MKKKLMLILLLSTLLAKAQNSALSLKPNELTSRDPGMLRPVLLAPQNDTRLSWPEEKDILDAPDGDGFSSLMLSRQLAELDQATPFRVLHHPTLERYIRVFLKDQRPRLERVLARSAYYFPMIEKQLDQNDLPIELKYLAVVESSLNPEAVSPSGAKGMWQFMYGTGKEYGMLIDSYVDQRFDYMRSTEAACQYLKRLYETFGQWDLALAAYNSGPGNVRKAIQRSGGQKDYWAIRKYLPAETRGYLPSFYASLYLFEYAEFHQLQADHADVKMMRTDTVRVRGALNLDVVSQRLQIETQIMESLNPQYKNFWIPFPARDRLTLTLPESKVSEFIAIEDQLYDLSVESSGERKSLSFIPINSHNSYVVKKGDNLSRIATKHQVSVAELKKWNGLETNYLIAGQRLVVTDLLAKDQVIPRDQANLHNQMPKAQNDFTKREKAVFREKQVAQNNRSGHRDKTSTEIVRTDNVGAFDTDYDTYKVQPGDTLFRISRLFENVSIAEIRSWNGLDGINHLQPGMVLRIVRAN